MPIHIMHRAGGPHSGGSIGPPRRAVRPEPHRLVEHKTASEPSESSKQFHPRIGKSGGIDMNSAIRWRIISLQAAMVVVLAAASAFAFGMGTFTTSQIRDELTAQQ